jgi:N,N'-diacetyllegionaminate synthase
MINQTKPYIIAEIGINHNGSFNRLAELIKKAKISGANAVKFQLYTTRTLARKEDKKKYKLFKKRPRETLFQMWERLKIKKNWLIKIKKLCKTNKIDIGFSVFDEKSFFLAKEIKPNFIKIASSEINNYYLLKKISKARIKIFISTGMANLSEIKNVKKIFKKKKIFLLHCVSLYPTKLTEINLKRMIKLKKFTNNIGFSDHTIGIASSITAITMGAKVIEKHFTLDKNEQGPDHACSCNPDEMKEICNFAKNYQNILGTGKIKPSKKEEKMKIFSRKSIFAKKNILVGERFNLQNIESRRPEKGINVSNFERILGKKSSYNFKKDQLIYLKVKK